MNTGNKGKFSERIKRIMYNRKGRKKDSSVRKNIIVRIILFPLMLVDKKIHEDRHNYMFNKETIYNNKLFPYNKENTDFNYFQKRIYDKSSLLKRNINQTNIRYDKNKIINKKVDYNKVNIDKNTYFKDNNLNNSKTVSNSLISSKNNLNKSNMYQLNSDTNKTVDLSDKIIVDISNYLIKNINNLETIESDLYVLSQFDGNKDSLKKCREYIAKLHALQNKLNKIRKQFNILKENVDYDDILEIDDKMLLDKLMAYKNSIDNNIAMQTTKNYKLLDEYKYLYSRIDKVVNDVNVMEVEVSNRKRLLEKANIDFNEFQNRIYNFDKIEDESNRMIARQDEKLQKMASKISDISVTKKVDYIYKGFLDVFFNGLKLLGLYMLSPFKKSIPGVASTTIATKKTMSNLIDAMQIEKRTKYIYSATNYGFELSLVINDLSSLDNLISSTLSDVSKVKREFVFRFSPYASQLPRYNSILRKINRIEKNMVNNQIKVRLLSEKMRDEKRINEDTLVKVKKLNNN